MKSQTVHLRTLHMDKFIFLLARTHSVLMSCIIYGAVYYFPCVVGSGCHFF
uniref:Uncharacterized protein n=1 Tax=Anguilla anguilla TaxID=7936 RepID=A0A0E9SRT1_ANGAN